MRTSIVSAVLAASGLARAPAAAPHYLWLERAPAGHSRLYFGEVQEGVREVAAAGSTRCAVRRSMRWDVGGELTAAAAVGRSASCLANRLE